MMAMLISLNYLVEHNVADYFTRPVTHQEYLHYEQYMWPQLHMAQWTAM